jgi:enoyl-CoA hydratase
MPQQLILTDVTSGVLTLTLNRPEKLNALSPALLDDLFAALRAAEDDEQVGAVIIKGAGRAFCTGYDITPGPDRQSPSERGIRDDISAMERNQGRWRILWNLNKPTIAQVHGYCVAGGTDLA